MKEEILEFINRRFKKDCNWLDGNCYYFAKILQIRFPKLEVVYFPIEGHFMTWDKEAGLFYDAAGAHEASGPFYLIEWIKKYEPFLYERLVRDCIQ